MNPVDEFDNKPYQSVSEYIFWLKQKQKSYAHEIELAREATAKHAHNANRLSTIKEKHQAIKEELDTFDQRNDTRNAIARNR